MCKNLVSLAVVFFFSQRVFSSIAPNKACTWRVGFCGIFKHFSGFGLFLLSNISHARPHAGNANRWANPKQKAKSALIRKFRFIVQFRKSSSVFCSDIFQVNVWVWFSVSRFSISRLFLLAVFSSSAKVQVCFYRFPKLTCFPSPAFLFKFGFDWSSRFLLAKSLFRLARFSKSARLFSAKVLVNWVCNIISVSLAL